MWSSYCENISESSLAGCCEALYFTIRTKQTRKCSQPIDFAFLLAFWLLEANRYQTLFWTRLRELDFLGMLCVLVIEIWKKIGESDDIIFINGRCVLFQAVKSKKIPCKGSCTQFKCMISVDHSNTHSFSVNLCVESLCKQISGENHQKTVFDQNCIHERANAEVNGIECLQTCAFSSEISPKPSIGFYHFWSSVWIFEWEISKLTF